MRLIYLQIQTAEQRGRSYGRGNQAVIDCRGPVLRKVPAVVVGMPFFHFQEAPYRELC